MFSQVLPCTAKVCTSWIRLKTTAILLGDCNVAERVTRVVEVRNLSQMPAPRMLTTGGP